MTVSTTTTKAIYNGDGSTTAFPTTFEFFDAADIEVIERVTATGAETVKTLSTDYTVSGGNGATGTVTAVAAPASTVQWAIRRKTPLTQQIDYVENDDFPAETHEQGLDRAVMITQERQEELDRALKFPVSDAASLDPEIPNSVDRAGQFLAFDVSGNPIAISTVSGVPVSAFMQTLLDDADAATGRTTLGLGDAAIGTIGTDVQAWDADLDDIAALIHTNGNVLTSDGSNWTSQAPGGGFPSGTSMLFQQTAAPTGWTKQTTHNNKAIRLTTGTVATGGANSFSTVFGTGKATASHTLTTGEIPAHSHVERHGILGVSGEIMSGEGDENPSTQVTTINTTATDGGSGGGHTHNLSNLDLQFVDFIIATKD